MWIERSGGSAWCVINSSDHLVGFLWSGIVGVKCIDACSVFDCLKDVYFVCVVLLPQYDEVSDTDSSSSMAL